MVDLVVAAEVSGQEGSLVQHLSRVIESSDLFVTLAGFGEGVQSELVIVCRLKEARPMS